MGVLYYLSSVLNIIRLRRKLPVKPETWSGPYATKRQAEEMKEFIEKSRSKSNEKMKINRGG